MNAPFMNPKLDKSLFSNLPKDLGFDGNSDRRLRSALLEGDLPAWFPSKSGEILKAMLSPDSEKTLIMDERQPRVFGSAQLIPLMVALSKGASAEMNVGMSVGSEVSPALPAYLELGLQRLKELSRVGAQLRLRVFSTGSLSPHINNADPFQVKDIQHQQRELLQRYVRMFYPDLEDRVSLEDIEQIIDSLPEEKVEDDLRKIQEKVSPSWLEALRGFGSNHGGEAGYRNALLYAIYHAHPQVFRDDSDLNHLISVGGTSEAVFNEFRFHALQRPGQCSVGIVIPPGVLSKTPPYLDHPNAISIPEFVGGSDRVDAFLQNPKANRHLMDLPGARDLIHIGRCLSGPKAVGEGLHKLREFYQANA